MNDIVLTVMIPTYNRKEQLKNTLRRLQNQTTQIFNILIVDNCSDYSIKNEVFPFLEDDFIKRIKLHRNRCNVGGVNFFVCIENCDTEWGWLLGDDDTIHFDAVETILKKIKEYPDCTMMHFSLWDTEKKTVICRNAKDVADEIMSDTKIAKNGGDMYWISNKVYNIGKIKNKYLQEMYAWKYCGCAHSIPMFMKMEDGDYTLFVNGEVIADYDTEVNNQVGSVINNDRAIFLYTWMAIRTSVLMDLDTGLDWEEHCAFVRAITVDPWLAFGMYLRMDKLPFNYRVYARWLYEKVYRPCYPWYTRLILKPSSVIISTKPGYYLGKKCVDLYRAFKHRKE